MNLTKKHFYSYYLSIFPICLILGNASLNLYFFFSLIFFIYEIFNFKFQSLNLFEKSDFYLLNFFLLIILFNFFFHSISFDLFLILRFLIFYLFLKIIFLNKDLELELILKFYTFIFLFVLFDTLIQYFLGVDIFGFEISKEHSGRLTGPFGDEPIPGSFLISFMFTTYFFLKSYLKLNISASVIVFLSVLIIFLSGEKVSFLMSIFGISLLFLFNLKTTNFLKSSFLIIIFFILCYLVLSTNVVIKARYIELFNYFDINFLFSSQYMHHFLTGMMIFFDYPFFGIGHDNFKIFCNYPQYSHFNEIHLNLRCAPHVHNFHFQILINYGSFLYFIFVAFIIVLLKELIKSLNKILPIPILIQLIILFIPLKTTGDLFATWYGSIFWFNLAFLSMIIKFRQ